MRFRALAVVFAVVLAGCAAEKSGEPMAAAPGSSNGAAAPGAPPPATTATTATTPMSEPPPPPALPPLVEKDIGSLGDANGPTVAEDPCAGGKIVATNGSTGNAGGGTVSGAVDADAIRRVIQRNIAAIRRCYKDLVARDANVGRVKLVVKFTIGTTGDTANIVPSGGGGDAKLMDCVTGAFRAMHFPAGSEPVTVSYPILFDPQ